MLNLPLPPEREEEKVAFAHAKMLAEQALIQKLLHAVHDLVAILNQERQIVYANPAFLRWLELEKAEQVCGTRLGEAMQCVNARQLQDGCGATDQCQSCGALRAILSAQKGNRDIRLFEVLDEVGNKKKLHITTTPIQLDGQQFILFSAVPLETNPNLNQLQPQLQLLASEMQKVTHQLKKVSGEQAQPALERMTALVDLLFSLVRGQNTVPNSKTD